MYLFFIVPKAKASPHSFTNPGFHFKFGKIGHLEKRFDPVKIKKIWLSDQLSCFF